MTRLSSRRLSPTIFSPWLLPIIFLFLGLGIILFRQSTTTPRINELITSSTNSATTTKKVLVLNFDPIIESAGGKRLHVFKNWSDPQILETDFAATINEVSHGLVTYQIVERQDIDAYPHKKGTYQFTDAKYLSCLNSGKPCNNDGIDYNLILQQYQVCEKLNAGEIDELWLWGGPWFGYFEANMAGPGAFDTNGDPVLNTTCKHKLNIMGFNYERSLIEMLEDFGHRTEGTMVHIYGPWGPNQANAWNRFTLLNRDVRGLAGCGNIHFPPNGLTDWQYNLTTQVSSYCNNYTDTYPIMITYPDTIDCHAWGCDKLSYFDWWFSHLPHTSGSTNGVRNNWWSYVVDYDKAIYQTRQGTQYFMVDNSLNDYNLVCGKTIYYDNQVMIGKNANCALQPYVASFVFPKVNIPKKAVITNAYVSFVVDGPYTNALRVGLKLSSGSYSTGEVVWRILEKWDSNTLKNTPDLTPSVQQLVSQSKWIPRSAVKLTINYQAGSGHRRIFAYERNPSAVAKLVVNYTLSAEAAEQAAIEDATFFESP